MKDRVAKKTSKDRAVKVSVSLTKPLDDFAQARAAESFDKNTSMYVRSLIKRDMMLNGK